MPFRSRGRRAVSRGTRRKKVWVREVHSFLGAVNVTVHDMCEDFCAQYGTLTLPPGVTVAGVKLEYRFRLSNAAGLTNSSALKLGIVVFQEAGPVGNADVPRPFANPHARWLHIETILPNTFGTTVTEATTLAIGPDTRTVRARRKVDELGQSLFWAVESNNAADTFDGWVSTSTLLLMP